MLMIVMRIQPVALILRSSLQLFLDLVTGLLSCLTNAVGSSSGTFFDAVGGLLYTVCRLLLSRSCTKPKLVQGPLYIVLDLGPDSSLWSACAVAEVVDITTGQSSKFVGSASLISRNTIGIKIRLKLGVGPGIKGAVLGRISSRSQIRGHRRVSATARFGGAGISILSLLNEFVPAGTAFLRNLVVLS